MRNRRLKTKQKARRPKSWAAWRRRIEKDLSGILVLFAFMLAIALIGFLIYRFLLAPLYGVMLEPESAKNWIGQFGWKAPIVFIFIMFAQIVVAVIPGEPLQIAAGFIFGPVWGTIWCLIGILLGSVTTFLATRIFGMKLLRLIFSERSLEKLNFNHDPETLNRVVFLLFVIPGTPKDLMTYGVGLTQLSLRNWIAITLIARFPSIMTATFGGQALSNQSYGMAILIFTIGALFSVALYVFYEHIQKRA